MYMTHSLIECNTMIISMEVGLVQLMYALTGPSRGSTLHVNFKLSSHILVPGTCPGWTH